MYHQFSELMFSLTTPRRSPANLAHLAGAVLTELGCTTGRAFLFAVAVLGRIKFIQAGLGRSVFKLLQESCQFVYQRMAGGIEAGGN